MSIYNDILFNFLNPDIYEKHKFKSILLNHINKLSEEDLTVENKNKLNYLNIVFEKWDFLEKLSNFHISNQHDEMIFFIDKNINNVDEVILFFFLNYFDINYSFCEKNTIFLSKLMHKEYDLNFFSIKEKLKIQLITEMLDNF